MNGMFFAGCFFEKFETDTFSGFNQQARGECMRLELNVWKCRGLGVQCAADFAPCGITVGMQNARAAVSAFASEGKFGSGAVKLRAPGNQVLDALRTFFNQNADGFRIAEAVTGLEIGRASCRERV